MRLNKAGFTIAETIVAIAVIASMIVAMLGYVNNASRLWLMTDQSITLSSEASMIMDVIRLNAQKAINATPSVGVTSHSLRLRVPVSTGTWGGERYEGWIDWAVRPFPEAPALPAPPALRVLRCLVSAHSPPAAGGIDFMLTAVENNPRDVSLLRFTGTMTAHLASFTVTRVATRSIQVYLKLEMPLPGEIYGSDHAAGEISTPSYETTGTFFMPSVIN